jgi:hypothetical protein
VTEFTDEQLEAFARLTLAYPAGFAITEDRAIPVYDSLVESGHAVRVESDDFEGKGYQLSAEMAAAHRQVITDRADQAGQN